MSDLSGHSDSGSEPHRYDDDSGGFEYPVEAPEKTSTSVPREGHNLNDNLHFSSYCDVFTRPDITDLVNSAFLKFGAGGKSYELR